MRVNVGWEGIVVGLIMLGAMVFIVEPQCCLGRRAIMGKVGGVVIDPKAGLHCRITPDKGDRSVVSHDKWRGGTGPVTIEEARWCGVVPGATVFACDLDSMEGRRLWARLVDGAAPGGARTTPLGALVEHVKRCRSLSEVKATCEALVSAPGPQATA